MGVLVRNAAVLVCREEQLLNPIAAEILKQRHCQRHTHAIRPKCLQQNCECDRMNNGLFYKRSTSDGCCNSCGGGVPLVQWSVPSLILWSIACLPHQEAPLQRLLPWRGAWLPSSSLPYSTNSLIENVTLTPTSTAPAEPLMFTGREK